MNYFRMTTKQLEQEHSVLQGTVRNSSPFQRRELFVQNPHGDLNVSYSAAISCGSGGLTLTEGIGTFRNRHNWRANESFRVGHSAIGLPV
jgi:hypothetical protein